MSYEDLLEHFRLEAQVFPQYTIHTLSRHDRVRRVREKIEKKWERGDRLGEGAFGEVWQESHRQKDGSQETRAVKVIRKQRLVDYDIDFKKELLALAKFSKDEYRQANIFVTFFGWYENAESVFLAMEYFRHGDLSQYTVSTEDDVRDITVDLLEGLRIMHKEGFTHRDLKPQNIFVARKPPESPRWWVKIGDFGIAKRVKNEETALHTQIGTMHFQAPEISGFVGDDMYEYSNAVDVWSLGCVIFAIAAHRVPFEKAFDINRFCRGRLPLPEGLLSTKLSMEGIDFIKKCLVAEPAQRISVEQALENTWVLTQSRGQDVLASTSSGKVLPNQEESEIRAKTDHQSKHPPSESNLDIRMLAPNLSKDSNAEGSNVSHVDTQLVAVRSGKDARSPKQLPTPEIQGTHDPADDWADDDDYETIAAVSGQVDNWMLDDFAHLFDPSAVSLDVQAKMFRTYYEKSVPLYGHRGRIHGVAFSPNGRWLASGSGDERVRIWDAMKGKELSVLIGHTSWVYKVAFSPDNELIASVSNDETVCLWRVASSDKLRVLTGHTSWVYTVAFSPDGKLLATGSNDETIRIWNVATRAPLEILTGHKNAVNSVTFSPDGKLLASGSSDKTVRLWDMASRKSVGLLMNHTYAVNTVTFSPDGKLLASGSYNVIQLWNINEERMPKAVIETKGSEIVSIVFLPGGKMMVSCSYHGDIRFWNLDGQSVLTLGINDSQVFDLAVSSDAKMMASCHRDSTIRLWGVAYGTVYHFKQNTERESMEKKQKPRTSLSKIFNWR